ncbi:hypothetical protein XA68_14341 [Ophiocordyceps unilateralis]|uniref:Acyltransferase MbtK/IucB-like conserved domain-containing protein n=1 Tax=Ophiocordyceps unilateralis TaxID=268505 RepID=A0A2A9PAL6_OPHUN|nr:hypothetical protein XA68_14341 [Ophiocordyceps unilateralis]
MTPPQILRLPDGQTFTVSPVFAGVGFRSDQLNASHHHPYPVGWTTVLHTAVEDDETIDDDDDDDNVSGQQTIQNKHEKRSRFRPFSRPTANHDSLFISSTATPPDSEFKTAASPTRQMAMLLWVTLCWYFHQPEPDSADWSVEIRPQGVLRGRNLLPKLERMGLVAARDSSVLAASAAEAFFVERRMFWQTPARLFLFTLEPVCPSSCWDSDPGVVFAAAHSTLSDPPLDPFSSTSHLPTYYPPAPLPHIVTNGLRHPLRPRPPRMGDVFYSRFIPSVGQHLSFRVASSSPLPVPYRGPLGPGPRPPARDSQSDTCLLRAWHAIPRVSEFWGAFQADYLHGLLADPHSFPAIGLWDGVPFGYFELYWAKEDLLGRHAPDDVADWDRGIHVMIGEDWARGRVAAWLTSLVHWCFIADLRTMTVCLEPRVDNSRMLHHLEALGFVKQKIVTLPHKQSWYVTLRRESWQGPSL